MFLPISISYRLFVRLLIISLLVCGLTGCGLGFLRGSAGGGGYFKDDGPGKPPANLDLVPNAVPKIEPIRPSNTKPYTVSGINYQPMTSLQPYRMTGIASWYGQKFHGSPTASGEIYNMYGMTAAHTILPIPSYVRVTRTSNGKSVIVRVNDRGPFLRERIIDLSYTAAYKLDMIGPGSAEVTVELLLPDEIARMQGTSTTTSTNAAYSSNSSYSSGSQNIFIVQVGAFSEIAKAQSRADMLISSYSYLSKNVKIESTSNIYRVHIGPFVSKDEAEALIHKIQYDLGIQAIILSK